MAKKQIENENTGFIWAVCCQCKEYFSFLDSKGLYNDTIPEDLKCPECERLERNKAKVQKFAEEKGIKNRSVIKNMIHVLKYDKNSDKCRMSSVYKEAIRLIELARKQRKLAK